MRLQLLSDLHLETEEFNPEPAPGAELLVLAGDIDSRWQALERFAHWPVPVLFVAGNHEFDGRDLDEAWAGLRARCAELKLRLLECERFVWDAADGRRVRFVGTVRWSDFGVFGAAQRIKALRAGGYFARVQRSTRGGAPFDAAAVREEGLACRQWLTRELAEPAQGRWDATVVVTHFAPSLRSADPRYGHQASTASFCNADDDLFPGVDLWLHGHVHRRHDYVVEHPDGRRTRVVSQARGAADKREPEGFEPLRLIGL
ncbi:metallophosphoesterase [Azohydromonas caseinilytica]|uniref:Phosphoesterase n=1 Tax=Azohydromonas caseinilytica TaxID=2728836 RepID=A0A848F472_9BURK|nr:metallophosphoesterase [Azohydromonas caseinilytica]NML13878.1 phosphoesterase [Azohydromonas caseinilytica]